MKAPTNILTDLYPEWLENGIFNVLDANYDMPWHDVVDGMSLDLDYYGNRSGSKIISPLLQKMLTDEGLSPQSKAAIAKLIYNKYQISWKKAWDAMIAEYNPLENYDRIEEETTTNNDTNTTTGNNSKSITDTGTVKDEKTNTGTSTIETENTGTQTMAGSNTGTQTTADTGTITTAEDSTENGSTNNNYNSKTENDVYGFNSTDASDSDDSTTTQNNASTNSNSAEKDTLQTLNTTNTRTDNLINNSTRTDNLNETETTTNNLSETNTKTNNLSSNEQSTIMEEEMSDRNEERKLRSHGNIGVQTSQYMLESELNLRFDWNFFNRVFDDVDKILTINMYGVSQEEFNYG